MCNEEILFANAYGEEKISARIKRCNFYTIFMVNILFFCCVCYSIMSGSND